VKIGRLSYGKWIETEPILTFDFEKLECRIEQKVLSQPGDSYITVGRIFG